MDHFKQYPSPVQLDYANSQAVEVAIDAFGLTTVDLLVLSLLPNNAGSLALSQKIGRSYDDCSRYLKRFEENSKSVLLGNEIERITASEPCISTGIHGLDGLLVEGIPLGAVTEIFGASGSGKSQFLLQLALQTQLLTDDKGKAGKCIYISTESAIETRRLTSMIQHKKKGEGNEHFLLEDISYIYCQDLEKQDHIMFTQLPAKLHVDFEKGENVKSIIIDSIGHHFRGEDTFNNNLSYLTTCLEQQEEKLMVVPGYHHLKSKFDATSSEFFRGDIKFRNRTSREYYLLTLYMHLSDLARKYGIAVVIANQVSDQFEDGPSTDGDPHSKELTDPLNYSNQIGTFSGWELETIQSSFKFAEVMLTQSIDETIQCMHDTLLGNLFSNDNKKRKIEPGKRNEYYPSINFDIHLDEFDKLYNILGSRTKRIVPTLGYTWTKLINSRVLLSKSYQPILDEQKINRLRSCHSHRTESYDELIEGFASPHLCDLKKRVKAAMPRSFEHLISSWKPRHYAKVLTSHTPFNYRSNGNCVEFEITEGGLSESQLAAKK